MKKKINVLFIQSQTYFGADSMIHSLLMKYFDQSEVEVFVACNPGNNFDSDSFNKLKQIPNIHLRPTYFGYTFDLIEKRSKLVKLMALIPTLLSLIKLGWFIKKNDIDIIHGTEKPRDTFYGVLLAKATGTKIVIHLHVKPANWMSPLVRWALGQVDGIIGVSKFVADAVKKMGYPASKTFFVLNSLELSAWDYLLDGKVIKKEFNIKGDTILISVVSRLFYWKGHTELLKALAIVKKSFSNFILLIVGEDDPRGDRRSGSYTEELKVLINELNLKENVIFTGFRTDIPNILAASDIYAMPSYEEPQGVVFLEAMAMRKPIVALNNGGTPEVVEHGKIGLLSEPYNINQLAENILALIENPEKRFELGKNGRQKVEETYNPSKIASEFLEIYKRVLNS